MRFDVFDYVVLCDGRTGIVVDIQDGVYTVNCGLNPQDLTVEKVTDRGILKRFEWAC